MQLVWAFYSPDGRVTAGEMEVGADSVHGRCDPVSPLNRGSQVEEYGRALVDMRGMQLVWAFY